MNRNKNKIKAIILASGSGTRFSGESPKQFQELDGAPLIVHTLKPFYLHHQIDEIIVIVFENFIENTRDWINRHGIKKVSKIETGGKQRQESSSVGLEHCGQDTGFVLIHDAVRPFVSLTLLDELIEKVKKYGAVVPTIPPTDTIIEVNELGFIEKIPNRETLKCVQTPQAFKYEIIKCAHEHAVREGIKNVTDDCSLVSRLGHPIYTIKGDEKNIKITFPQDLEIADAILKKSKN